MIGTLRINKNLLLEERNMMVLVCFAFVVVVSSVVWKKSHCLTCPHRKTTAVTTQSLVTTQKMSSVKVTTQTTSPQKITVHVPSSSATSTNKTTTQRTTIHISTRNSTQPLKTKQTTRRTTHKLTTKRTTPRHTHPLTTKKTTPRKTTPTTKKTTPRHTHPPTTKKTTPRKTTPTTKKTTLPTTKKTTPRHTHPQTTKKTTQRKTTPTTKKTTPRHTHPPTTKKTTSRRTHPPTTKKTTPRKTTPTTKKTTPRHTHPSTTKKTTLRKTTPTTKKSTPTTKKTTPRHTHPATTKKTTPRKTTQTAKKTTARHTHQPTTKKTTPRHTHLPTTKKTTPRHTHPPTTKKTTTRHTHPPTTKKTTPRKTSPTTKKATPRHTHPPTTKKATPRRTPPPTTKKTTPRRTHPPTTKKATPRRTHPPTTKKATPRRTPPPTTKKTTPRRTHPPTTKKATPRRTHPPTTKKATPRRTPPPTTKKTTPRRTHPPTTKKATPRRTHPPTTKKTTPRRHPPTTKKATPRRTHPPTTKKATPRRTHPPTTKKATPRRTHPPTTKKTTPRLTHPPITKETTPRLTHPPTTKKTPRHTHPPTTKKATPRRTPPPTTKKATPRRTHPPTTKKATPRRTHPSTPKKTTPRRTHPPTTKKATPRRTHPPTTKKITPRHTHPPTTKKTTPRHTHTPTTKKTTPRLTHPPTTKKTPRHTHPPTTKKTTPRHTHPPTTKKTTRKVTTKTTRSRARRALLSIEDMAMVRKDNVQFEDEDIPIEDTTVIPQNAENQVMPDEDMAVTPKDAEDQAKSDEDTAVVTENAEDEAWSDKDIPVEPEDEDVPIEDMAMIPKDAEDWAMPADYTAVIPDDVEDQVMPDEDVGIIPEDAENEAMPVEDMPVTLEAVEDEDEAFPAEDTGMIPDDSPTQGPTQRTFPHVSDNYQVEVEANIIDKGYTVDAKIYYDYIGNKAAISVSHKDAYEDISKYIYSYDTDEIFITKSGLETDCTVQKLTSSTNIYSNWLFGYTFTDNGLHISYPTWQVGFNDETDYEDMYLGNASVRGITVDHWQGCGRWKTNSTMLIDYYFAQSWNTAWSYPRVPVRTEIMADKLLPNGSVYSLHHIYDFFNFQPFLDNDPSVFQTPKGVVCPGRKNTQVVPALPQSFYYKIEIINAPEELISYEDIWYDSYYGHYRKDYRPVIPQYPTFNTNPLTEIHDYHIGVRYIIDKTLGNCTILPLTNTSGEATLNSEKDRDSYLINLKNPLQLFNLEWNYTYIGKSWARGMLCDMYVTERQNLFVSGFMTTITSSITVYFLAKDWIDYVNEGPDYVWQAPVKMELNADDIAFSAVYNFIDFSADKPFLDVYDVSPCFSQDDKLKFQVTFPGQYQMTRGPDLKNFAHQEFAIEMGVNILRVQEVGLEYDDQYIYISATLLGNPPPPALFEYVPGKVAEKEDDSVVFNVSFPMQCPNYCVSNKGFVCNSYDFCSYIVGDEYFYECRLSRAHTSDGIVLTDSKTCDHFSRSVNGEPAEPSIMDAYKQLRAKVYNHSINIMLVNPDVGGFFIPDPDLEMTTYTAVDISVTFGWITSKVDLPKLKDYLHYRIEATIPFIQYTYEAEIWYDKTRDLIRVDPHYNKPIDPYYTTNPLTIISDFSTGLQYVIDRVQKNCTIQAIPVEDFGAVLNQTLPYQQNSTWSLRIKTPYELLHIDNTYQFVGQKTVRGMLCNVFESLRLDYQVPRLQGNYRSVFRYFFLSEGWYEVSEESGESSSTPVRLEVTVVELGVFLEFDFYDFNSDRPDISTYDIHSCFESSKQNTFEITFPGPVHPYLDTEMNSFKTDVVFTMSRLTGLSPLRFQRTRIDYDSSLYITTTLVGQTQVQKYFTHINDRGMLKNPDGTYDNIQDVESCAQACYSDTQAFVCNSFYYCLVNSEKKCLLSKQNAPDSPDSSGDTSCQAYSRTVTARDFPPPSTAEAFMRLKNYVYRGKLQIEVLGDVQAHLYIASMIRINILSPRLSTVQKSAMQQFKMISNSSRTVAFDGLLEKLSVDDCAQACLDTLEFQCQGFSYCDTALTCWIIKTRPGNLTSQTTFPSAFCYIYQRTYLDDFTLSPGTVSTAVADYSDWPISSADVCAMKCSQQTEFQCKSFEYCQHTNECLLFKGRTLGVPLSDARPSCLYYTRNYLTDFEARISSSYTFTSDIQVLQVSAGQCAQLCIQQQGTGCHGFYYCHMKMACHLMSVQSHAEPVNVNAGPNTPDILCRYYRRIDNPETTSPSIATSSSSSSGKISSTPIVATSTTIQAITTFTTRGHTVETFRPPVQQPTTSTTLSSSSRGTSVTPFLPTALQQTGSKDGSNSNTAGTVVGVAFATFILGLVIGAAAFHFLNRQPVVIRVFNTFMKKKEPSSSSNKEQSCIEMGFSRLEETDDTDLNSSVHR